MKVWITYLEHNFLKSSKHVSAVMQTGNCCLLPILVFLRTYEKTCNPCNYQCNIRIWFLESTGPLCNSNRSQEYLHFLYQGLAFLVLFASIEFFSETVDSRSAPPDLHCSSLQTLHLANLQEWTIAAVCGRLPDDNSYSSQAEVRREVGCVGPQFLVVTSSSNISSSSILRFLGVLVHHFDPFRAHEGYWNGRIEPFEIVSTVTVGP